jgi:hypothetical protein
MGKCCKPKYLLMLAVVAAACFPWQPSWSQEEGVANPSDPFGVGQPTTDPTAGVETCSGFGDAITDSITTGIPDLFTRRLLFRLSVGEGYNTGISDPSRTNVEDFHTTASASASYNWRGERSTYGFNYAASARRFNRIRGLGSAVNHAFGVRQTLQLGPRTAWGLSHRFSLTPDFSDVLLGDEILQELSFGSPLPRFGAVDPLINPNNLPTTIDSIPPLDPLPDLGTPLPAFVGPPQGSIPLYSFRTSNSSQAQLSHALSARTSLSFGASYNWMRYRDDDFPGSDHIGVSASVGRMLTQKTSLGFGYFGGRLEQPGGGELTWLHGARVSLSRQLAPGLQASIGYGPVWIRSSGQEEVPLSPVLANLLGTPTLFRDSSRSFLTLGWNGAISLSKRWEQTSIGIGYSRGISSRNALSSVSKSNAASVSLGRRIGQGIANISASASYIRSEFITLQNVGRFDHASGTISLSRQIASGMDFSIFARYSRLLTSAHEAVYAGRAHYGINFVFHFPRVRAQ